MKQSGGAGRGRLSASSLHSVGHDRRGAMRANAAPATAFYSDARLSNNNATSTPPSTFMVYQWKAFASVFGNLTISNDRLNSMFNERLWIIDIGASNHVTGDVSFVFDIKNIVECHVGLPYGQKITATKEGSVKLSSTITLQNFFYVPKLNCNLFSVSQFCDNTIGTVQFNSYMCVIHDQMRKLIGMGIKQDGLYYFKGEPVLFKQSPLTKKHLLLLFDTVE
ncbi:hypothetical protein V6N11_060310 [Hibiscus sabdariffa]|uniref:Retrovirus-related Pol polyprotein from transposon TNT 1-94-like beta-barrel domain-containing protein n=1 Tax=Hibiscus sabdariffa TaxID=183260 RepID=A0ABR2QPY2_9ROSI